MQTKNRKPRKPAPHAVCGSKSIEHSGIACDLVADLEGLQRKTWVVIALDRNLRPLGREIIFEGSRLQLDAHTSQVFAFGQRTGASALILAHNEVNEREGVSAKDYAFTKKLIKEGILRGVPLLDHLVVTDTGATVTMRGSYCYELPHWHDTPRDDDSKPVPYRDDLERWGARVSKTNMATKRRRQ